MSAYLKLDYSTPSVNDSLKVAIVYIGKHYGKNANKKGLSEKQYLNSGIKYIAKKFGRFRVNAIKTMVYSQKSFGNNRRWAFNKQVFARAYNLIIRTVKKIDGDDKDYILRQMSEWYNKYVAIDNKMDKSCRNIFIFWQTKMLHVNAAHPNQEVAISATKLYNNIVENDLPIF